MKVQLLCVLLSLSALSQHVLAISFVDDHTPEGQKRKALFKTKMDEIRQQSRLVTPQDPPTINATTFGDGSSVIKGFKMETIKGKEINAFEGFRYATAERFQLPELVDQHWEEEYRASHIGPMCPQIGMISQEPTGDEDCLFLNVYSPKLPDGETLLPVMLFIHGGGFTNGDSSIYLPTKLLDHDVILVTIHYRLGTLGFFFMDNDEAPGNYALYDQAMSLEWVQKHISDFGGDKDRVTVFGQSAGGVSASFMQINPKVKGKLHGIISHSGSTIDIWSVDQDPMYATEYISKEVGCFVNETDITEVDMECMRTVPADDLVNATTKLVDEDRCNGYMGFRGVSPTIQGEGVSDPILTMYPTEYFHKRQINDVPQMMGTTKQEGSFVLGIMYKAYLVPNDLDDNIYYLRERLVPDIIEAMGVYDVSNALSVSCILEYCPDIDLADFNDTSSYCLIDMTGALFLKAGAWETANLLSYFGSQSVYVYSFDFMSNDTMFDWIIGEAPFRPGVTHSDDLMYLFPMPAVLDTEEQKLTMDRMTLLWTNFATYLDPTPEDRLADLEDLDVPQWFTYKFEDTYYMLMRDEFIMQEDFLLRWTVTIDEMNAQGEVSAEPPILSTRELREEETTPPPETTTEVASSNTGSTVSGEVSTSSTTSTTTTTTTTTSYPRTIAKNYQNEYDEMAEEADAYMAAMITFIIATYISCIMAVYFFFQSRKR